jgi:hypothetical protein
MKVAILPLCIVLGVSICALGFVSPDYSGNWIRDAARSDAITAYVDGKLEPITGNLVVRQNAEGLNVESSWSHKPATKVNYILDGNDHSFTDESGNSFPYRVTLNGDQLVIERIRNITTPFGSVKRLESKEEWSLSADKNTLIILTTIPAPKGASNTQRQIYTKE